MVSPMRLRLSSPRRSASYMLFAWSVVILAGSGGSFGSTTASTTTGPGVASAWRSVSPQCSAWSMWNAVAPQPSAILTKSTGAKSTPYSGLPRKIICSHLMSPSALFLNTISLTGSSCCMSVARSPICMVSEPSPVNATTWRSGYAVCAPIA
jgi:hypothetical protein